jgi:allantoinase
VSDDHSRDLIGYGARPPDPAWPRGARLAFNLVVNYEEGAEYCVLNGDARSESILSDLATVEPRWGERDLSMESGYEYGSRYGLWRVLRLIEEREFAFTTYAVGQALEQNPEAAAAIAAADCDVVSHAWRWIDYHGMAEDEEHAHIRRSVDTIARLTGTRPIGWYTGRPSLNTRRLVVEEGGFLYDCDAYNDDLPYWTVVAGKPHLVICHSFDHNDSRFTRAPGFALADDFFTYVKDAFDWLYAEGAEAPKMMTVAVHCRLIGRPGRIAGLARLLDHVARHDDVWICQRGEIARHWIATHPYQG